MSNIKIENCKGKLVFLEANDVKNNYYNGEYICVNETENNLYCVSPKGGYDSSSIKVMPLIGESKYSIISVTENKKFILEVAKELEIFAQSKEKNWVESVYTGAKNVARKIRECFKESEQESKSEKSNVNILVEKLLSYDLSELTISNYKALQDVMNEQFNK